MGSCVSRIFVIAIDSLPDRDLCEIGERGITLSGGQKQRVSIARAVYMNSDLYILDDPLSAVDVHVCKHIFEQCIIGTLAGKTRLLITNQLHLLPHADKILVLEEGKLIFNGLLLLVRG